MRRPPYMMIVAAALLAGNARARAEVRIGVADEAQVGASQVSTSDPRTYYAADKISALVEAGDSLALKADFKLLHDDGTRTSAMQVALDCAWSFGDHLTIDLRGDFSPSSSSDAPSQVQFTGPAGRVSMANADLRSVSDSYGGGLGVDIFIAPDAAVATTLSFGASVEHFDSTQNMASVTTQAGAMVTSAQLAQYCATHTCSAAEQNALASASASVNQLALSAGLDETIHRNTDVALTGTLYLYDGDPNQVGYFDMATLGAALAPLAWSVRPDVSQKIGPVRLTASFQYGEYVDAQGWSGLAALKAQVKISRSFKMWLTGSLDVSTMLPSVSMGARYYF